jgi:hypothetical protein
VKEKSTMKLFEKLLRLRKMARRVVLKDKSERDIHRDKIEKRFNEVG